MSAAPVPLRAALDRARDDERVADARVRVLHDYVARALGEHAGKAAVNGDELAAILRVGRSSAFEMIRTGRVPTIQVSQRRRVVPVPALVALLLDVSTNGDAKNADPDDRRSSRTGDVTSSAFRP